MNIKKINSLAGVAAMLFAANATASTVSVNPDTISVIEGTSFSATIAGDFIDVVGGTAQGGVSLFWDPTVLTLNEAASGFSTDITNVLLNQFISNGGDAGFTQTIVDAAAGTLTANFTLCTLTFGCDSLSTFNMFDLVFDTINTGSSPIDAGLSLTDDVWWDDTGFVVLDPQPTLLGATVTVSAIPVPAAVWLFGSGLIGMVAVARRRKTQLA